MKLKMPGRNGVITVNSNMDRSLKAEAKTIALVLEAKSEALATEVLSELRTTVDKDDIVLAKWSK